MIILGELVDVITRLVELENEVKTLKDELKSIKDSKSKHQTEQSLSKEDIKEIARSISSSYHGSTGDDDIDAKLKFASEMAIQHFKKNPPRRG